jgi:hypothetical protein
VAALRAERLTDLAKLDLFAKLRFFYMVIRVYLLINRENTIFREDPRKMDHTPTISTIAGWAEGRNWTLELQHSRERHAMIWQTRARPARSSKGCGAASAHIMYW